MEQQVEPLLVTAASQITVESVGKLDAPLLTQLPADVLGKAAEEVQLLRSSHLPERAKCISELLASA